MRLNYIDNIDCLEGLRELPDCSIDCVITSPPYNFNMQYETYNDDQPWELYFSTLRRVWVELFRVLKDDGRLIVNVQPAFSEYVPTHHMISRDLLDSGFKWKGEILWEKNNYNCKYSAWGSWKSPASPYLKYTWEFVEVYVKKEYKHAGDKENIDITGDEFKKWVLAKWSIAPERHMKDIGHPAMFPEELPTRLLKLFTYKKDVVLDPFMGAGTTAVACIRTGRSYIGFELGKEYHEIATARVAAVTQETAVAAAAAEENEEDWMA